MSGFGDLREKNAAGIVFGGQLLLIRPFVPPFFLSS